MEKKNEFSVKRPLVLLLQIRRLHQKQHNHQRNDFVQRTPRLRKHCLAFCQKLTFRVTDTNIVIVVAASRWKRPHLLLLMRCSPAMQSHLLSLVAGND